MTLTKFRLLTTAGEISAQAEILEGNVPAASMQWMSQAVASLIDSRGKPIYVRGSAIVAVVEGWG